MTAPAGQPAPPNQYRLAAIIRSLTALGQCDFTETQSHFPRSGSWSQVVRPAKAHPSPRRVGLGRDQEAETASAVGFFPTAERLKREVTSEVRVRLPAG